MKKHLIILIVILLSLNCFAQISFEKGYYIDNTGQKIDCLIKNIDWKNNPIEFDYKLSENSEQKKATITIVKEFGIYNVSKYVRSKVNIDRSSKILGEMSTNKNPNFKQEQLFLKVLIEGKASLYGYTDKNLRRYFYTTETTKISQLIFKKFKNRGGREFENNEFKQQLWNDLKCQDFSIKNIEKIDYNKSELTQFFTKYNNCNNSKSTNYNKKQKKDLFNLSIRPGLNSSSLNIDDRDTRFRNIDYNINFGNQTNVRLGLEAEFILPFNKNKWAIIIEPTFQQFKSERTVTGTTFPVGTPFERTIKVDYSSLEIPFGVRHYIFLSDKSKLFINGLILFDIDFKSIVDFEVIQDLDIKSSNSIVLGFGYNYGNRYNIECRFATSRDLLSTNSAWSSDYQSLSFIIGYTLF